jgi:hypothetical protein
MKNLKNIEGLTAEQIETVQGLIDGSIDPEQERFPRTSLWVRSCYHRPKQKEIILSAIDETIETFGVEGFELSDGTFVSYCNTGDSYAATVVLMNGQFQVASWGDLVEQDSQ